MCPPPSSRCVTQARERRGGLIPVLRGDHFLWILECRSFADRDSLDVSLRGLGGTWSSGRQALGRHDVAAYASTHTPPHSGESAAASRLKLLQVPGAGLDRIDRPALPAGARLA